MKKVFEKERFGYTGTVIGNVLTIKSPLGIVIKQAKYRDNKHAKAAWYSFCNYHNLTQHKDAMVIDLKIQSPEEQSPLIEKPDNEPIKKPAPTASKIANNLPLTAIIDFNFINSGNVPLTEWIQDINNRIKSGEYHPSEILRIRLVPNA